MAKKNDKDNAIALTEVHHDPLGEVIGDVELETDGLEEVGAEDIKIAVKVFNMKGTDQAGDPIPANVFFDTVQETTAKAVDAVLLTLHKSNEFRRYDEAAGKSEIVCRSMDRVTGTMNTGEERQCKGCPDAQWRTDPDTGRRTRNCGPVYNVIGIDRETRQPFVIRFKRTSLSPFQQYLNKHFLGRRVIRGQRFNFPLFAFQTQLSLRMSDDKKYSLPVLERGDVLPREEILQCVESAKFYREVILPALEKLADQDDDTGDGGRGGDTSFDVDAMSDESDSAQPTQTEQAASGRF